jgi:hypothetical protein
MAEYKDKTIEVWKFILITMSVFFGIGILIFGYNKSPNKWLAIVK